MRNEMKYAMKMKTKLAHENRIKRQHHQQRTRISRVDFSLWNVHSKSAQQSTTPHIKKKTQAKVQMIKSERWWKKEWR